jgi:hypothetical protein
MIFKKKCNSFEFQQVKSLNTPVPRQCLSACPYNGNIYFIGGQQNIKCRYNEIFEYNEETSTFKKCLNVIFEKRFLIF